MTTQLVLLFSVIVLAVVVLLLVRELRGPGPAAAPPVLDEGDEEDDPEVTRMAPMVDRRPKSMRPALPAVQAKDEVTSPDDADGSQSIVTVFGEDEGWGGSEEASGPHDLVLVSAVGQTDPGKRRARNEDSYLILKEHALFVVADGMGGHAAGEVASRVAVEAIGHAFASGSFAAPSPRRPRRGDEEPVSAIRDANEAVHRKASTNPDYEGMGTTVIGARFSARKQRVYVAYVGDSRCYRLRGRHISLLTTDHTLGAKGVTGPMAGNLCRAVGVGPKVHVDLVLDSPQPGDCYLICSDGLSKMLDDDAIAKVLRSGGDLEERVKKLIHAANASGGRDNITVILVNISAAEPLAEGQSARISSHSQA